MPRRDRTCPGTRSVLACAHARACRSQPGRAPRAGTHAQRARFVRQNRGRVRGALRRTQGSGHRLRGRRQARRPGGGERRLALAGQAGVARDLRRPRSSREARQGTRPRAAGGAPGRKAAGRDPRGNGP